MTEPEISRKDVVVITGSSGLIGSATARRLADRLRVVGFDRAGDSGRKPESVECVCVDVTSDESVQAGFSRVRYAYGNRIASVIHLAAYYDFSGAPSPKYEEITVRGTERLLGALHAFETEQFIFSSTILVHAPSPPGEKLTEDSPLGPKWEYPESKVATEQLIRAERDGIPAVLLRIAGVYDDRCHSIPLAHQIQRIYERQLTSHFFPGDVTRGRQSFVHLDDLVEALAHTVEHRAGLPAELALLIGEPEALSYEELQDELGCLIHGKEWETIRIPELMAEAGAWVQEKIPVGPEPFIRPWMVPLADDDYVLDITRAKNAIAWEPRHNLRESIPKMVEALRADPLKWYRENKLDAPSWLDEIATAPGVAHPAKSEENGQHPAAGSHGARTRQSSTKGQGEHGGTMPMPGSGDGAMDMPGMGRMKPGAMMAEPQAMSLWVNAILMLLGAWLITSPATLGYRSAAMAWSDIASGALIIIFAAFALSRRGWAAWATGFVGAWLLFAPLIFWAPTAAGYLNNTLIGALVIAFSILIPMGMPMTGPDVPRGWSYNPSTWLQRAPIIALGFIGLIGARYMAAYQLGHIDNVWEPFFGDGTVRVLESDVSRAWPVSDAGLGATTYMLEILMGLMGGKRRWRTMPWMVSLFGILVVPLGVTSIVLIILQPLSVGAWCTICLATALTMLVMIPLTLDEVVAMGQFLAESRRAGKPFWRTFWMGGDLEDGVEDTHAGEFGSPLPETPRAMTRGVTLPWALLASAALGVWLMFAPSVLGIRSSAADSNHLLGALVVTFAVIALAEVGRVVRFANLALGAWVALSPWVLTGASGATAWGNVVAGALLILLSIPRGRILQRYGSWERIIR